MILAGDIGGTKTVVALFERRDDRLELRRDATFPSRDHASLEEILTRFLEEDPAAIDAACFGVAGPVVGGQARTTNLPWTLDEAELARAVGARRVKLLNDLEAAAYGMLELGSDERARLNAGADAGARGNVAVIAAGTGLGEAVLFWDGARHHAVASEGGHASFAARTDEEIALLRFLQAELGQHVSTERVLSGPGLYNIYRFLRETGSAPEPDWLTAQIERGDPGAAVGRVGLEGRVRPVPTRWSSSPRSTAPRRATWRCSAWPWAGSSSAAVSRRRSCPPCRAGGSWRRSPTRAASPACSRAWR